MANPPLAAALWPSHSDGLTGALRAIVLIVAGTTLLTLSAKIKLPLPYVPMTLQTLVVLLIGAAYGWRLGLHRLCLSRRRCRGIAGICRPRWRSRTIGRPTAGYLFGFVVAAFITGWLSERGWDRSVPRLFVAMGMGTSLFWPQDLRGLRLAPNSASRKRGWLASCLSSQHRWSRTGWARC